MDQSPRRLGFGGQPKRSFLTEDKKEDISSSFPCFLSVCVLSFSSVSSAKFVVPKRFPSFRVTAGQISRSTWVNGKK